MELCCCGRLNDISMYQTFCDLGFFSFLCSTIPKDMKATKPYMISYHLTVVVVMPLDSMIVVMADKFVCIGCAAFRFLQLRVRLQSFNFIVVGTFEAVC